MALAIALVIIVAAAALFQFFSPWWLTPLASNWRQMDDTLFITLVITGAFFVAINLFLAWAIIRYRHRDSHRAAYMPHNKKLEWWLTGLTTIGIVAMLAPGLFVYAKYLNVPRDALVVEVVGQQWQWRFRFPGADGKLGTTDIRYVSDMNPFGLNPNDRNGQDDILVDAPELHLPIGKPVKVLLRSRDVLHDFYVPAFRARMNMVPGLVTDFWFTPTKTGRFEILCAQLCGIGHFNMRGMVVVDSGPAYRAWLAAQPTFAQTQAKAQPSAAGGADLAAQGKALAQAHGCIACHSIDGSTAVGPTWKDLYGKTQTLTTGKTVRVDEALLKACIMHPADTVVQGYPPVMPNFGLNDADVNALVAYIKSLGAPAAAHAAQSGN